MLRWMMALAGLFLAVFAVVALSGPGQFDISDGWVRYEVARSLVEHGDVDIQAPKIEFTVLPGRGGRRYSQYRFPQSAAGVAAILAADATGPVSEGRREFFFSLTSAVAAGALAVAYASLFRHLGLGPRASLLWAAGGVFYTPSWYYGTSTFDDILGTAAVVLAVAVALGRRPDRPLVAAVAAGLLLGLAFNCKQPLGIFVLPVMAALDDPKASSKSRWSRLTMVAVGLAAGVAAYLAYDWYKFPPGSTAGHAELLKYDIPTWSGDPVIALVALLISPAAGVFFYNPPLLLCVWGMRSWYRSQRLFCLALSAAIGVFVLFICSLTCFKGDVCWGPRYLTPVFAILWILAPAGSQHMRRWAVVALLGTGLLVQLAALSIDPRRLAIERGLPSHSYLWGPDLYFHPAISHLLNRPREIVAVLAAGGKGPVYYSSPRPPTFVFLMFNPADKRSKPYRGSLDSSFDHVVVNTLRPWWASLCRLHNQSPPVDIKRTTVLLVLVATSGLILMFLGIREHRTPAALLDREHARVSPKESRDWVLTVAQNSPGTIHSRRHPL